MTGGTPIYGNLHGEQKHIGLWTSTRWTPWTSKISNEPECAWFVLIQCETYHIQGATKHLAKSGSTQDILVLNPGASDTSDSDKFREFSGKTMGKLERSGTVLRITCHKTCVFVSICLLHVVAWLLFVVASYGIPGSTAIRVQDGGAYDPPAVGSGLLQSPLQHEDRAAAGDQGWNMLGPAISWWTGIHGDMGRWRWSNMVKNKNNQWLVVPGYAICRQI